LRWHLGGLFGHDRGHSGSQSRLDRIHLGTFPPGANALLYRGQDAVIFFDPFQEIRDVQKGISLQPDIYEGRLHPGQNTRDSTLADAPGQTMFLFALEIHLDDLPVFQNRDLGLVAGSRDHHLFCHALLLGRSA
jgi:hypothetical protein